MKDSVSKFLTLNKIFLSRRVLILLGIIVLFPLASSSQTRIDSLNTLLCRKSGIQRIEILFEFVYEYSDTDYRAASEYANEVAQIALENGDSLNLVKASRLKCRALRNLSKIDSAIAVYNIILPVARRNNYLEEVKFILNGLGVSYTKKAQYDKALEIFFESLELKQKDGDKFGMSVALNNLGMVYVNLGDFDKALLYYKQSLKLKNGIDSKYDLDLLLLNIGSCYAHTWNFSEARNFTNQGLSACEGNCSETVRSIAEFTFGLIDFKIKNLSGAKEHFLKAYELSKKQGDEQTQLEEMYYLLKIYIQRNELRLAEKYIKEVDALIAKGTPYNAEMIEIYTQLFSLYSKSKNFERVAFYQHKYISLKDSIFSRGLTTNLMKIEGNHLEKENKAKIEYQNKILVLNEEVMLRQRVINVSVGIVAVLVVMLAMVLARSNKRNRTANLLLDEKVKERTRELEMNRDALQRICEERDAVVSKASADIKSSIATIKGLCLLGMKDINHPNAPQYLRKMETASDHVFDTLNKMIYSYRFELPIN